MSDLDYKKTEIGLIPQNWKVVTLGDQIEIIGGGTPKTSNPAYWDGDIPWLSVVDFNDNNRFVYKTEKTITDKGLKNSSTKMLKGGDVIISARGTVGALAQLGKDMAFNQSCYGIRGKTISNDFLYYILKNAIRDLKQKTHGAVFDTITRETFSFISIALPNKNEQRLITNVLSSLDDKIELNRQINSNLEKTIRALFKLWFIDFEFPNKNGKPYKTNDGKMVDSELGLMPEGWTVGTLGQIAENKKRGVKPNELSTSTAYIGLEHMPRQSIAIYEWGRAEGLESNKFEFNKGEILFGKLRPYFHKVGVAPVDGVCSTDILVIRPKDPIWYGFLLCHVSSVDLINHTSAGSTGTKMPRTNWKAIAQYEAFLPTKPLSDNFNKLILPMLEQIAKNIHESETLGKLRDSLLPHLMSGKVRVSTNN